MTLYEFEDSFEELIDRGRERFVIKAVFKVSG